KFELEQVPLPVDPLAASEQAYIERMSSPEAAPEWARVTVNESMVAAPATVAELEAKIATLEKEHAEALANLGRVQEEQRSALNALLAQKRDAENAVAQAAD